MWRRDAERLVDAFDSGGVVCHIRPAAYLRVLVDPVFLPGSFDEYRDIIEFPGPFCINEEGGDDGLALVAESAYELFGLGVVFEPQVPLYPSSNGRMKGVPRNPRSLLLHAFLLTPLQGGRRRVASPSVASRVPRCLPVGVPRCPRRGARPRASSPLRPQGSRSRASRRD